MVSILTDKINYMRINLFLKFQFFLFILIAQTSIAQLVTTEPIFPTQFDNVTVYFDASKGNAALEGFTGDVYAHTGVITTQSNASNDWKYVQGNWGTPDPKVKMLSLGNNIYSLSYNVEAFYGLMTGDVVEKLAFVFRNADGSIVGRDTDGSDIFYDVYPPNQGLLVNLQSPANGNTILYQNEELLINLQINQIASVEIKDNGSTIFQDNTDQANFPILATELGQHMLDFTISFDLDTQYISTSYFVLDNDETPLPTPTEIQPGVSYLANDMIGFMLVAPLKKNVFLLCPENGYTVDIDYKMNKSTDGNSFWISLPKSNFDNGKNTYQYLVDGNIKIADPYAEVVLDPWNDDEVSAAVMIDLPSYPVDMTTGIVTAFDTEKVDYPWEVVDFTKPEKSDLVIYELLLRDFLSDHSYTSLTDTLDYLKNLGITAIELMPINEFEGNNSWGYNPSFHMAVDKYYGSREQLKKFIDESHKRGIAVILDVVFNHAFSQSPLCQMWWDPAAFRPSAESPFLNEVPRHPFNVGYDFNHQSPYTRQWVKRILTHWTEEYRFDGYRFDLSKGLTQTNSGNNSSLMSQYDESRINVLKDYADHIWSTDGDAYVILEHFAENLEEEELSDYGMMLWANTTFQFAEAAMGYSSSLGGANYKSKGWDDPHLIAYMESHDEERMAYKIKEFGNSSATHNTKETWTFSDRMVATSMIYLCIPGPKMLWQFGELGYDFSINRCEDGSVNNDCRLSPKPVRWDFNEMDARKSIYDRMSAILELRNNNEVFKTTDFTFTNNSFTKSVVLNGTSLDVVSIANFNVDVENINITFPELGTWYEYFTGEVITVNQVEQNFNLRPSEYRIYLTEPLSPSSENTSSVVEQESSGLYLYPNPVNAGGDMYLSLDKDVILKVELMDMYGRRIMTKNVAGKKFCNVALPHLSSGAYHLLIHTDHNIKSTKLIIN